MINIIPKPLQLKKKQGVFLLDSSAKISGKFPKTQEYLNDLLNEYLGFRLNIDRLGKIKFVLNKEFKEEEYELIEFPEFPEKLPEFPGGDSALRRYITDNLKYPEEAKSKGLEGKVFVSFIVCETGNIEDVQVKGVDPLLDSAVVRLVQSMPKWEPAKQRGKTITYPYIFPIVFSLEKAK